MAGAGFKTWTAGEVLTASQLNTYIQQQTLMVFASASARTSALGTAVAEGMTTYLLDTNEIQSYDGSVWNGVGGGGGLSEFLLMGA